MFDADRSHVYTTDINLDDNFPQNAHEYIPFSYHGGVFRLSDAEYGSNKSIKFVLCDCDLLYRKTVKLATNHFLFLRQAFCAEIPTEFLSLNKICKSFLYHRPRSSPSAIWGQSTQYFTHHYAR